MYVQLRATKYIKCTYIIHTYARVKKTKGRERAREKVQESRTRR